MMGQLGPIIAEQMRPSPTESHYEQQTALNHLALTFRGASPPGNANFQYLLTPHSDELLPVTTSLTPKETTKPALFKSDAQIQYAVGANIQFAFACLETSVKTAFSPHSTVLILIFKRSPSKDKIILNGKGENCFTLVVGKYY